LRIAIQRTPDTIIPMSQLSEHDVHAIAQRIFDLFIEVNDLYKLGRAQPGGGLSRRNRWNLASGNACMDGNRQ
jgi:hypothetical protein